MKMRRLPEIDLARIGPLSRDEKKVASRRQKQANPPYAYHPTRSVFSDIFNVKYPLAPLAKETAWEKIEEKLQRLSKNADEYEVNVEISKMLYAHATENKLIGRAEQFFPLPIGIDEEVRYWFRLSYVRRDRLMVPYIDPRKRNSLGPKGRTFAFSMMHQGIREADPDFEQASFEIYHFGRLLTGARTMNIYSDEDVKLYTFEELDEMVRETYEVWREVLAEREEDEHKAAYTRRGSLI